MVNKIEIFKTKYNQTEVQVLFEEETVWLTQKQIVELFHSSKANISEHIKHIFENDELNIKETVRKFRTVQKEGTKNVSRELKHFNLDVIISVGYRVNSKQGTQFRQWATQRLKEYLVQGYAINQKRLEETENKFQELKQEVRLLDTIVKSKVVTGDEAQGLLKVLSDYAFALDILDQYDHQTLKVE
nr:RhuM family protein [uncultured Flavobacterium sp.]